VSGVDAAHAFQDLAVEEKLRTEKARRPDRELTVLESRMLDADVRHGPRVGLNSPGAQGWGRRRRLRLRVEELGHDGLASG
jgi:hypothetical protein